MGHVSRRLRFDPCEGPAIYLLQELLTRHRSARALLKADYGQYV